MSKAAPEVTPPSPVQVQEVFPDDYQNNLSEIPSFLVEHFLAQDKRVLFAQSGSLSVAQQSARRRMPVMFDELPAAIQKRCKVFFEPPDRNGGLLKRGDAILFEVPLAAEEHFKGQQRRAIEALAEQSDDRGEALNEEFIDRARKANLPVNKVRATSTGHVADQAIGGPAILEMLKGKLTHSE